MAKERGSFEDFSFLLGCPGSHEMVQGMSDCLRGLGLVRLPSLFVRDGYESHHATARNDHLLPIGGLLDQPIQMSLRFLEIDLDHESLGLPPQYCGAQVYFRSPGLVRLTRLPASSRSRADPGRSRPAPLRKGSSPARASRACASIRTLDRARRRGHQLCCSVREQMRKTYGRFVAAFHEAAEKLQPNLSRNGIASPPKSPLSRATHSSDQGTHHRPRGNSGD